MFACSRLNPTLPALTEAALLKGLSVHGKDRPQTAVGFCQPLLRENSPSSLCLSNCHGSHGFTTGTWVFVKSPTFRETMVRLCWSAVAASKPSMADKGLPLIFAPAASRP